MTNLFARPRRGRPDHLEVSMLIDVDTVPTAVRAVRRISRFWASRTHCLALLRDALTRTSEFKVLAARGLTLTEVGYPADELLATRAEQTRARRDTTSA